MDYRKLIVIDVEATRWERDPPIGQFSEIIEIGVAELDMRTFEISNNDHKYVVNEYSTISRFCTDLTGITQDLLDKQGILFKDACHWLCTTYKTKKYPWLSYGDYDREMFRSQCAKYLMKDIYPFSISHLNIKSLLALQLATKRNFSMSYALKRLGLKLEGVHHCGKDDAYNVAKIATEYFRRTNNVLQI